ncbi:MULTISPECIES: bifunctional metallophosphatase/5'-nucleotidase [Desulfovibrio]|uniref:Bifunctional metallophosphatase/5'-nucleotidase n=1 Tax=Desulfovibrio piger TaxID=901 RepID=A0A848CJU1_9BACT|nr:MULTISPECIES: bifunctional metallophosphatase/5'-nucleotidase [Desulfovibrio]MDD6248112.1 bifunctional metallophosphatase/5'-nucleotidase [Desulfovibrio piger]MDY4940417.1 bifunctional metallophosphatase/5'-nucleotidase [Desulfovibrio sp.]NME52627.1 bifunctional metallophosphatase/5'-nucleotidase [Desulfovibrio piger]
MPYLSHHVATVCTALLFLALSLVQGGCSPARHASPAEGALSLTILHTNDTHSHIAGINKYGNACFDDTDCRGGLARIATAIRTAKSRSDNIIALDAGDQFQGTLFYSVNKWPMLAELDQHMPYDAMTLGNHEFDEGCLELTRFLAALSFPVLAANLKPAKGCPMLKGNYAPYTLLTVRGQKVAVVGIANNEVVSLAAACPRTFFEDTAACLQRTVKDLEAQGVKHIIALTHIGLSEDRKLARSVDGVDIIVGGHSHSYLGPDSEEGPYPIIERSPSGQPVLVVTAKRAAQYLGELNVIFDAQGVPLRWNGGARELAAPKPRDAETSALVQKYATSLDEFRNHKVGSHHLSLPDGIDACREDDCLGGSLIADAMLEYARPFGGQVALCNGGSVRAALPAGDISRGDLLSVIPFGNTLVMREITGERLLAALEHGVSEEGGQGPRLLHTAGLRYVVDAARPAGSRIVRAEILDEKDTATPLDLKARYVIVTIEYLARGGDAYAMLKDSKVIPSPEPIDITVVEDYLKKHSPLPQPKAERIIRQ